MKKGLTIVLGLLIIGSASAMIFPERDVKGRAVSRQSGVQSDSYTRVRFIGTHDFNITGNQTAQSDWTIPQQTYNGNNVTTVILGVQFKVVGGCDGDKVTFRVVHPNETVLDEFATNFYVFADSTNAIKEHRAEVPAGLKIRVIYTSTCGTAARFLMNLYRYMETE